MSSSLAELGSLSPGLRRVFNRYDGTAMLAASAGEVQRLRRHLFESCRVEPADLALFDHFPPDDRQVIARELHALVHDQMRLRQEEHARHVAAQAPVEAVRRALLSDADRRQLVDLGIWAHVLLGESDLADELVDRYLDLTTEAGVRNYVANRAALIAAFRDAVLRCSAERSAGRRPASAVSAPGALSMAYATLGLASSADRETVCQAYRSLAKRHHPDLGGSEARMKELNQAYSRIAATWR